MWNRVTTSLVKCDVNLVQTKQYSVKPELGYIWEHCLNAVCSCGRGCVLHMLGAIPRSAIDDHLHPWVDHYTARNTESPILRLRWITVHDTTQLTRPLFQAGLTLLKAYAYGSSDLLHNVSVILTKPNQRMQLQSRFRLLSTSISCGWSSTDSLQRRRAC